MLFLCPAIYENGKQTSICNQNQTDKKQNDTEMNLSQLYLAHEILSTSIHPTGHTGF